METKTPPPPIPEVAIRTLESDARSIAAGEATPEPEIATPPQVQDVSSPENQAPKIKKKPKIWLWILIPLLIILAFTFVYFFILPTLSSSQVEII
ncbi:MAG: hypothetical protein COU09_00365 [Candidatus Harrisonbacteria bacterium CG10_big_fil_rev_8_21_14_0_10_44_23]|uniref:Uncharacterized protein n=1 Tax=Candidatus Harrisonbacteria bacterium CG10_big_fil_rev_8_21_14_0_10_44_23 TaxID=1974585 RepID=A0A2H0UQR2_9BACT|nr:MAG: hypothetical protein COU09_00365 [Candidatus Harrisonbacteria bacterium CG10_big_fil_rev_8_21_14_0_10_44_23]